MQQLTGMDASFLHMETAATHGHVGSLAIFDPSGVDGFGFEALKRILSERLHLAPPLRRRLVEVPFGLDQPYWIEDPNFDLDYHVREIALPSPGDEARLAEQVARIHERPLDRARPLWEMYLIWGLADGHVAQYTKMHHSAIDGVSGAEILATLLDLEPEPRPVEPPEKPWKPDPLPSQLEMLLRGARNLATQPLKSIRFQRRTLETIGRRDPGSRALVALLPATANLGAVGLALVDRLISSRMPLAKNSKGEVIERSAAKVPRTRFNGMITAHRRFSFGSLSLDTVKEVKNAFGVTVNDVVLAVCAGGLRRYLLDRNELPETPLVAMVPVSVRTKEEQGSMGNKVSAMMVALATEIADPVERIQAIHDATGVAKEQHKAIPADLLQDYSQFATPALAARAARAVARTRIAERIDVPCNLTISNIPGPNFPLYGIGARLVAIYPVSAVVDGMGLNITVMSYMGSMDVGVVACREMLPDPWALIGLLRDALDELQKAATRAEEA